MKLALPAPVGLGIGAALVAIPLVLIAWSKAAPAVAQAINPLNPENVFAGGANAIVASVTGDPHATVGASWWETWNPSAVAREREAIYGTPQASAPSSSAQASLPWWGVSP